MCLVTIFTVTITILALVCAVSLCIWSIRGVTTEAEFLQFKDVGADCLAAFSTLLLFYLVFSYVGLRRGLNKIFGKNLSEDFKKIQRNFTIMVAIYGLFTFYMIMVGHFYRIICPMYIRWILNGFFEVAC